LVVEKTGRLVWGSTGSQPFVDNELLLKLIAKQP
jgi:hypothetical protein